MNFEKTMEVNDSLCPTTDLDHAVALVEQFVKEQTSTSIELLQCALKPILNNPGKQIRVQMLLLSADAIYGSNQKSIALAAIVQMIHYATLLHDDVIDEADVRRNQPTVRKILGNKTSILSGDYLYATAFRLIAELKHHDLIAEIAEATGTILAGEIKQWQCQLNKTFDERLYQDIIAKKTARLFELSTSIMCLSEPELKHFYPTLKMFGYHVGMAFQMIDDTIDYASQSGKAIGMDFYEKKITLPVLKLLTKATENDQVIFHQCFGSDLKVMLQLLEKYDVFSACRRQAQMHIDKACQGLDLLPNQTASDALRDIIQKTIERIH